MPGQRCFRSSLWTRGGAVRTFRGLALFAVVALFGFGGYLIEQQFANPLNAESVVLIFAAVLIATGVILSGCFRRSEESGCVQGHRTGPAKFSW